MPRPFRPSPTALGQLIRQRREAAHLSRAKLAKKAHLSESTLKNIEFGRHEPTRATLVELAAALEMPDLVGPQAAVLTMLEATGPAALAELLKHYSVQTLAEALRLAGVNIGALAEEQRH